MAALLNLLGDLPARDHVKRALATQLWADTQLPAGNCRLGAPLLATLETILTANTLL